MNRSFANVLFGAFGQVAGRGGGRRAEDATAAPAPEEAASILANATSVIIVPGYGMAVAQAQHKVRELYDLLTKHGRRREVRHPPGRRPHARPHERPPGRGRASPTTRSSRWTRSTPSCPQTDVALVIGANDVTNPAARHDKTSPIYGMPIIDADKARTVMVIKRSMNPGFAGIDNELYYLDQTLMLFGDAKHFVTELVKEAQAQAA